MIYIVSIEKTCENGPEWSSLLKIGNIRIEEKREMKLLTYLLLLHFAGETRSVINWQQDRSNGKGIENL